jgi:hypothetical protein
VLGRFVVSGRKRYRPAGRMPGNRPIAPDSVDPPHTDRPAVQPGGPVRRVGWPPVSPPTPVKTLLLTLAVPLTLWLRRPDQFTHPYVRAEDGTVDLPAFVAHGWASLLRPMVGYVILPSKLLHAAAVTLSFRWYPEISLWLTVAFTWLVLLSIALAPTRLKYPFLCATAVLLVPTSPEVFAVPHCAGWWGSLLAVLPLFWTSAPPDRLPLRCGLLAIGGLSSPLVVGLVPLYALRAAATRRKADTVVAVLAASAATLQASVLLAGDRAPVLTSSAFSPGLFVAKFFGYFLYWSPRYPSPRPYLAIGLVFCAILAATLHRHRRDLDWMVWGLLACFVLSSLASLARVSLPAIHPIVAGPRYFFLPFVFLSWLLIDLLALRRAPATLVAVAALALGARNTVLFGHHRHEEIDWRAEVAACLRSEKHRFPVHTDGALVHQWGVSLTGADCRALVSGSLFDRALPP